MSTLTYRDGEDWRKRQITEYLNRLDSWARRQGFVPKVVVSLEPSERGRTVPHYHVLIWLPRRVTLPMADKRGWWTHGLSNTQRVRSAVGYVSKYVGKGSLKQLPRGARCYSFRGLSSSARLQRTWLMLPLYVREGCAAEDRVCRARGGGWLNRSTGVVTPSRWRLVERGSDWSWLLFEEVGIPHMASS